MTASELASDLREGARIWTVPANLQPSLSQAAWVRPAVILNGCGLGRVGIWRNPCVYGDTGSPASVVVFGDSHAAMWFPALDLIAKQQHWRLIDLTKAGCPAVEVNVNAWFLHGVLYSACSHWRALAMAYIARLHPRAVIVTWERWLEALEAQPTPGIPSGAGSPWLDGVNATFKFLHHAARRAIFISDDPTLPLAAWSCLRSHLDNVPACTAPPGLATRLPAVKAAELRLAEQDGVESIDPTSWFCASLRCPVIVGNILVYWDISHMTPQWARFITPVLAHTLLPLLRAKS